MSKEKVCDATLVARFLDEDLGGEPKEAFLAHLEECEHCQRELKNAAANDRFWSETVQRLGQDNSWNNIEVDADSRTTDHTNFESSPTDLSIKTVIEALSPTDDPRMLGRIGEYEISGIVGIGGMGAVLKGFDKSLLRVVAIKVMAPHLANKGSARKRFEREARAAAAISHDNVVDIYRVDELNGLPYLVMPFARGPSLQKRIDESGPLSTIEVVLVGKQIASGLAAAHEQGLVHRDIKPANILLNDGVERILITDFGVARAMDDASMTQTGLIAGTPQFMSPEQARGEVVDQRSDLFSLGSLLYTICTGRPPFRAEAPFGVLRKITDEEPRSILELNPEIPLWLVAVIERLLEKDSTRRFEDAREVAGVFEKCLAHLRQPNQISLPRTVVNMQLRSANRIQSKPKPKTASGLRLVLAALALATVGLFTFLQITQAPEIAGQWSGEQWSNIKLESVAEAGDWYSGSFEDAEGNIGAIHLEWSRVARRFKGRWSMGSEKTGSIVVRSSDSDSLRGAISFDADAVPGQSESRLRDFVWNPGNGIAANANVSRTSKRWSSPGKVSAYQLNSPGSAVISRLAEGLAIGSSIKKGDFIAELTSNLSPQINEQKEQLKEKLERARNMADAYAQNTDGFSEAKAFSIASAEQMVEAAKAKYESANAQIVAYEAKVEQARKNYQRSKKHYDKGLISSREIEKLESESEVAIADLESARRDLKAKRTEVRLRELELAEKTRLADSKIEGAKKIRESKLLEIEAMEKELAELQTKVSQLERHTISAPFSGTISQLSMKRGNNVEKGELLMVISGEAQLPAKVSPAPQPLATGFPLPLTNAERSAASGEIGLGSIPEFLTFVSGLQTRIEKHKSEMSRAMESVEEYKKSSAETLAKLEFFKSKDAKARNEETVKSLENGLREYKKFETAFKSDANDSKKKLEAAMRELEAMKRILELELESAMAATDFAAKSLEIRTAQYDHGDADYTALFSSRQKHETAKAQVEKVKQLIEHVARVQNQD